MPVIYHSGGILEFGMVENLFFFDNSPDFGVHAAYTMSFFSATRFWPKKTIPGRIKVP